MRSMLAGTGWRSYLAYGLSLLIVALLVVTGAGGYNLWQKQHESDERAAAAQAARQMAVNTVSVDYEHAQQGYDRVLSTLTGEARDTWATQSKAWVDNVTTAQTKSVLDKVNAGVVSFDGDSAEVIVSVSALVTGPKVPQGVIRSFRYSLDMTKTGDRWLVAKIGLVP